MTEAQSSSVAAAFDWLMENDRPAALEFVAALPGFWLHVGQVDEGRGLTERAVDASIVAATDDAKIAAAIPRALLAASELAFRQGDQEQATQRARDCIRAALVIEDRPSASVAESMLARVAYRDGNAPEIELHARRALDWAEDDSQAMRGALHMLAWAAHTAGDLDEAERRFNESLDYRRRHGSPLSVAVEIGNLGDLAAERGQLGKAGQLLAEALQVSREIGNVYMLLNTIPSFAVLAVRAGFHEDAARLFGAGKALESSSGLIPDPNSSVDGAMASAREHLGDSRYEALRAEGEQMSANAAVSLSLEVARRIIDAPNTAA